MSSRTIGRRAAVLAAAALCALPARAKVIFTGYGDFRSTPQGVFRVDGPPSVLSGLGIAPERLEQRGNTVSAVGLFATTTLSDEARFQMDITYRDVGVNVRTIQAQYAYVDWTPDEAELQAGKITLPFGYYNQNRFYPFQRPSITGPLFISAIVGLPQADIGADAQKTLPFGAWTLKADVYSVNGYGPAPGSTDTFRSATLPGALTIAQNIGSTNPNHKLAFGGRLDLSHAALPDSSAGVSYYRGEWNPAGNRVFQMGGAHLHASWKGWTFLAEYLRLDVKGDQGMIQNFGGTDWRTDGFFAEVDARKVPLFGKTIAPWVRFEDYFSGRDGGEGPREAVWDAAGGASVQLIDAVAVKAQFDELYYALPFAAGTVRLTGYLVSLGLVATF